MKIKYVAIIIMLVGVIIVLCGCGSGYNLKGHTFSSYREAISLFFVDESKVTLKYVNLVTSESKSTSMTYKIEDGKLTLYDTDGVERIHGTIEEDGKLINLKEIDDGSGEYVELPSMAPLYRDDAQEVKESVESSVKQAISDSIDAEL